MALLRRTSMDRRPSMGRSESTLTGEGRNHVVFVIARSEYLPAYFKSMKKHLEDPSLPGNLEIVVYENGDLKKKMPKDHGRYLCIILGPEQLKERGFIDHCRQTAPGVPVYAYGNEPSGKYRKEIEHVQSQLDGKPLDGPSLLPGCKGSWNPSQLVALLKAAQAKTGSGDGGAAPAAAPRRNSMDRQASAGNITRQPSLGRTNSSEALDRQSSSVGGVTRQSSSAGMMMGGMPGMMGGMPGMIPGMQMPGMMGGMPGMQMFGMQIPGMPGQQQQPPSSPMGAQPHASSGAVGQQPPSPMAGQQAPSGMQMPGMPGQMPGQQAAPNGMQMPGMPGMPGQMPGQQQPSSSMGGQPASNGMQMPMPGMSGPMAMLGMSMPGMPGMQLPGMMQMPGMLGMMPPQQQAQAQQQPAPQPAAAPKQPEPVKLPSHLKWSDHETHVMQTLQSHEQKMIIALKEEIESLRRDIRAINVC